MSAHPVASAPAGLLAGRAPVRYSALGVAAMRFDVIVLASTHLVRQQLGHCLAPLGARIREFATPAKLLPRFDSLPADLLVMDADGMGRAWRLPARAAQLRGSPPVVLLGARFGFDEAHDALALGVSAAVLKPFRREEHTRRLYDLVLKHKRIRPRRSEPRFALDEGGAARLDYQDRTGEGSGLVAEANRGGLSLAVAGSRGDRLPAGSFVPEATLSIGDTEARLSAHVVHRADDRAGLSVHEWGEGRQRVLRLFDELASRAFGGRRDKRKW